MDRCIPPPPRLLGLMEPNQPGTRLQPWTTLGLCYHGGHAKLVVYTATWGNDDKLAQAAAKEHVWVYGPMVVVVCVDVPGPCCCQDT